ncbi:MAG TPA: universal stress protein [Chthoniobacterales bacterium]
MKTITFQPPGLAFRDAPSDVHLKNILVPLDLSETSLKSLDYAVPFARQFGAKITLLYIASPRPLAALPYPLPLDPDHFKKIEKQLEEIRTTYVPPEVPSDAIVRHDFVFDGIFEVMHEIPADLIIITTRGYTGMKHLLNGSMAENIVCRATCPVLVIHEMEHDFVPFSANKSRLPVKTNAHQRGETK